MGQTESVNLPYEETQSKSLSLLPLLPLCLSVSQSGGPEETLPLDLDLQLYCV